MSKVWKRVTIVHRHELFAAALEHAVAASDSCRCTRVVTTGMTTRSVLRDVARSRPDVVLAGVDLGQVDGIDVLTSLCRSGVRVIALIEDDRPLRLGEALATGAEAVLAKSSPLSGMLALVERAIGEEVTAADRVSRDALVREYRRSLGDYQELVARLSRQEKDLLAHLMAGLSVREVATLRFVSEATVRTQSKSVLLKLGVTSQLTAVAVARRAGHSPGSLYAVKPAS